MSIKLTQEFRNALVNYLRNPNDTENQKALTSVSFAIYETAVKTVGLEPDKYWVDIEIIIKPAVSGIKIHPHLGGILESFNKELSWSDERRESQAFHALNMALNMFLKANFIKPEEIARNKLVEINNSINALDLVTNPYINDLQSAYQKLKTLIDEHFALDHAMQIKQSANFEQKAARVCFEHKRAIESDAKIKSAFYNFLAVISSVLVIVGVSISKIYRGKSSFFRELSKTPEDILNQPVFTVPLVNVQDINEVEKKSR